MKRRKMTPEEWRAEKACREDLDRRLLEMIERQQTGGVRAQQTLLQRERTLIKRLRLWVHSALVKDLSEPAELGGNRRVICSVPLLGNNDEPLCNIDDLLTVVDLAELGGKPLVQ